MSKRRKVSGDDQLILISSELSFIRLPGSSEQRSVAPAASARVHVCLSVSLSLCERLSVSVVESVCTFVCQCR